MPRVYTMERRFARMAETRQRIIRATVSLLVEQGWGQLTLPAVAVRAGVADPALPFPLTPAAALRYAALSFRQWRLLIDQGGLSAEAAAAAVGESLVAALFRRRDRSDPAAPLPQDWGRRGPAAAGAGRGPFSSNCFEGITR